MTKLRKSDINKEKLVPKEGQRALLRSSRKPLRCPSLDYQFIDNVDLHLRVDRAFSTLFDEVLKHRSIKISDESFEK